MTNEELRRLMEFIVKRQEGFAENMDKADVRMTRLEGAFVGLFNIVNETAKAQKEVSESQKSLVEVQRHTDERLNILINTVERYVQGPNGRSQT